jgi:hypothetical protein
MARQNLESNDAKLLAFFRFPSGTEDWLKNKAADLHMSIYEYLFVKITNEYLDSRNVSTPPAPSMTTSNDVGRRSNSGPTFRYKGVYPYGRRWEASYTKDSKKIRIGVFEFPEDAARAYDDVMASLDKPRVNFADLDLKDQIRLHSNPPELENVRAEARERLNQLNRNSSAHLVENAAISMREAEEIVTTQTIRAKMANRENLTEADYRFLNSSPIPDPSDTPMGADRNEFDRESLCHPTPPRLLAVRRPVKITLAPEKLVVEGGEDAIQIVASNEDPDDGNDGSVDGSR